MTTRPAVRGSALLCFLLAALVLATAPTARADRVLITKEAVNPRTAAEVPEGQIEGACGVGVFNGIYVSDYYRYAVDVFGEGTQIVTDPLRQDGPCGLAFDASGNLFVNNWHRSVVKFTAPSYAFADAQTFDEGESTGVAVDRASGYVYVDDRTHVAVYEPSGEPVMAGEQPLRIGGGPLGGTLGDAYGVAVFAGRIYVPDAADDMVKVYVPSVDPVHPASVIDGSATPQGGFNSLVDAAVAVDPSNGHLLVIDNLQPGFEHPKAVVDEFDSAGNFLDQLTTSVIDGEPSGIAVAAGTLYVTNGNDEEANVFAFGPYTAASVAAAPAAGAEAAPPAAAAGEGSAPSAAAAVPQLRLAPVDPGSAGGVVAIRAVVGSPGTLAVSGRGLRPQAPRRVGAGGAVLRLRLSRAGRRALAGAKLRQLTIRVRGAFTSDGGESALAATTVTFAAAKERRESR
jgi:DNA-binding beta-propeller fold protein YncE